MGSRKKHKKKLRPYEIFSKRKGRRINYLLKQIADQRGDTGEKSVLEAILELPEVDKESAKINPKNSPADWRGEDIPFCLKKQDEKEGEKITCITLQVKSSYGAALNFFKKNEGHKHKPVLVRQAGASKKEIQRAIRMIIERYQRHEKKIIETAWFIPASTAEE
ncbi:MAG: hypothetical protein PHT40_03710 [Patescibacteria group bacterium]|nr:hypothetical protein [Patescibacteria group bacterium]